MLGSKLHARARLFLVIAGLGAACAVVGVTYNVLLGCGAAPVQNSGPSLADDARMAQAAAEAAKAAIAQRYAVRSAAQAPAPAVASDGAVGGLGSSPVRATTRPRVRPERAIAVAVFDIEDARKAFEAESIDQLTDYLAAQLAQDGSYRVIPRRQLRGELAAQKSNSYQACFDESCQIELGKAVAAEKSLATKLLRVGKVCAMTATLYDLKSETTERAATVKTECAESALIAGVEDIARQLLDAALP